MKLSVEQALQQGITAHREGKLREAQKLYKAILQSHPTHPDANHNLGVLAVSLDQAEAALPLFKTAIEANPKIEQFWVSLIDALLRSSQLEEAKSAIEEAKIRGFDTEKMTTFSLRAKDDQEQQKVPSQAQLDNILLHYQSGDWVKAQKSALAITKKFPDHHFGWKALGAALQQLKKNSEAIAAMQKSVQLAPQDAEALNNLGSMLLEVGQLEEAEANSRLATILQPDLAEAHSNLGMTLEKLGRSNEAEVSCKRAIALKPNLVGAHINLGNAQKSQNKLAAAEESYKLAIALKPDFTEAYGNLANTLLAQGELENAKAIYTKALSIDPNFTEAHKNIASIKKYGAKDKHYSEMLALYRDENLSAEQRCHISFGLAKASEDLGDFKQAFSFYDEANHLRKKLLDYDINTDKQIFEQIISSHHRLEEITLEPGELSNRLRPIFIVGMPRSGTTLIEQILSSHPQITGAGELSFVKRYGENIARGLTELSRSTMLTFRNQYLSKLEEFCDGNRLVIDKMPHNFLYLGIICVAFPEAKIVHVKRNPAAVCWSNYKQYFSSKSLGYSYSIDDVASYYKLYEDLMKLWTTSLDNRIYHLDYDKVTLNQESETRLLINYLELQWDDKCLSPQNNARQVTTASNTQIRKAVYRGSSQRWEIYREFLNGAFDKL